MTTSPEACPECKGSGRVIVIQDLPKSVDPVYRMTGGIGFTRDRCQTCGGRGSRDVPEPEGAYTWPKEDEADGTDPTTR